MPEVGALTQEIIDLLNLRYPKDEPIYLGNSNITHIQNKHSADYNLYGNDIPYIVNSPDYVGINSKDQSIEYVKQMPGTNDYVKVAVRPTQNGKLFVRSSYVLNSNRVQNFINKGTLKKP